MQATLNKRNKKLLWEKIVLHREIWSNSKNGIGLKVHHCQHFNLDCILQHVATREYCNSPWIQILFCSRLPLASHVVRFLKQFDCYSKRGTRGVSLPQTQHKATDRAWALNISHLKSSTLITTPQYLHK